MEKILVIQLSRMGDLVQTLPSLTHLLLGDVKEALKPDYQALG